MLLTACFLLLLSFPPAVAADWWDDFSNNFASDLAPLLSLFGEQVTKQFLSESISVVDHIIFAMAPMGILTAVVSVIRTCGSPSLRAFIGRAQEGKGIAEAELCSSTSRDVCELYSNGGIARVFGRPKILEIIFDPEGADFRKEAGIYTMRNYLKTEKSVWVKKSGVFAGSTTDVESTPPKESTYADSDIDLFAPNLSLNVGIKRQPTHVSWIVAGLGLFLQSGVMVFAGIATYYLKWEKDDKPPNKYSCPMMLAGTGLLGIGTFYCAFLIGESTYEQLFIRRDRPSPNSQKCPIIIWLQPGGQVLGDQTFDPFCYSDNGKPLKQYLTSWKKPSAASPSWVWAAIVVSMLGFVLQFTGLRGIHSAVSLAQTAVVLAMSIARSLLRTQRLKLEDNKFAGFPDPVTGHELDWLALHIDEMDLPLDLSGLSENFATEIVTVSLHRESRYFWRFGGVSSMESISRSELSSLLRDFDFNPAAKTFAYRTRLGHLTMSQSKRSRIATSASSFHTEMVEVRQEAQRLAVAITTALNLLFPDRNDNECLRWGVECFISAALRYDRGGYSNFEIADPYTVYLNVLHDPENQWKFENNMEVESLLGLWVWSLMSEPTMEKTDELSSLVRSRALEFPVRRIVSTAAKIENLKRWLPRKAFNFKEHTLSFELRHSEPGRLWGEINDECKLYRSVWDFRQQDNVRPTVRLFGWNIEPRSDLKDLCKASGTFKMISTTTSGTLVSSCAHEVFASFLASVLDEFPDHEDARIEVANEDPHLRSPLVEKLVKAFTDSQLGSAEEAMLCVLPPIVSRLDQMRRGGPQR
ncbi:unnamed protein product [Clonostachys byssicola]|uniref:Uncharacterized protein n=1 Tax=Clonostachys byssicola TaxID=160290 RepID=A0A9N9UGX3_9HYPO|nr:unnamed protein product [Clonostachys byssicola]